MGGKKAVLTAIPEDEFQASIIELAKLNGWLCAHFRPAQDRHGRWKTPMQGDPGWPDLVLLRERLIVWEVKSEKGVVSPEQGTWLGLLGAAGIEARVVRPRDFDYIEQVLARPQHRQTKETE